MPTQAHEREDQADEHVIGLGELAVVEGPVTEHEAQETGAQQPKRLVGWRIGAVPVAQDFAQGNQAEDEEPEPVVARPMRERCRQHLPHWSHGTDCEEGQAAGGER